MGQVCSSADAAQPVYEAAEMPDSKQTYRHQGKQAATPGLAAVQLGGMPSSLLDEGDLAVLISKAVNVRSFTRSDTAAPERETSQRRSFGSPRTPAVGSKTGAPLAPSKFAPARPVSRVPRGMLHALQALNQAGLQPAGRPAVFITPADGCHG